MTETLTDLAPSDCFRLAAKSLEQATTQSESSPEQAGIHASVADLYIRLGETIRNADR